MCGIVGVINPTKGYIQGIGGLIPDMLSVGTIRGQDSTGIMKVVDNKVSWLKNSIPGWRFVQEKDFEAFLTSAGHAQFIMGHNRWATQGEVSSENAHPFEHGHICLAHNGTIFQTSEIYDKSLNVDSHMITKHIAEKGIESTKNHLWGAFSLVWYDSIANTLNFLRNRERPMWFLHTKQKAIIFCSEPQMGVWCAERRGFVIERVVELPIDTLYSYSGETQRDTPTIVPMERVWKRSPPSNNNNVFSLEERNLLKTLAHTYKTGETFLFSLNDFNDEGTKGKFVQIFGECPTNPLVTCVGNYSGPVEQLYSTKTLLAGTITSVALSKKLKKVVLGLKTITITGEPDPFFALEETIIEKGKVSHKKAEEKPPIVLSSKSCTLCSHVFTRQNCDDPYLVSDKGVKRIVCVSCYMDRPGNNPDHIEEEIHLRH